MGSRGGTSLVRGSGVKTPDVSPRAGCGGTEPPQFFPSRPVFAFLCRKFGLLPSAHGGGQCPIHQRHFLRREPAHPLPQPAFFQRAYLLAEDNGRPAHAAQRRQQRHMRPKRCFSLPGGQRQYDDGGAEPIAQIILYDEHRADTALLRPDHRVQISKIYLASFQAFSRSVGAAGQTAAAADPGGKPPPVSWYARTAFRGIGLFIRGAGHPQRHGSCGRAGSSAGTGSIPG